MQDQRVVFLDIDGTMINFQGQILPSTVSALTAAKRNGHVLVICSGRSRFQIDARLLAMGFQGIVGSAGAYVEYEGQEVFHHFIEREHLRRLCDFMEQHQVAYSMQASTGFVVNEYSRQMLVQMREYNGGDRSGEHLKKVIATMEVRPDVWNCPFCEKANYHHAPLPLTEVKKILGPYFDIVSMSFDKPDPYSGEISVAGINKAAGMAHFLEASGMAQEQSIALGDGSNDVEMLEYAGIGVAMGNAREEARHAADYITDDIDKDGLAKAFEYLGLI